MVPGCYPRSAAKITKTALIFSAVNAEIELTGYKPLTYMRALVIMSLAVLATLSPLAAQFLSPEDTVKFAPASEPSPVYTPPATPAPQAAPAIAAPGSDGYFADFAAYGRDKNVILTWHLMTGRAIDKRMQIYRFSEEPRVIHDISKGTLIAKLTGEINLYEDVPPGRGMYYYAIFVETTRGLEPGAFTMSRNLVGPVSYLGTGAAAKTSFDPEKGSYKRPEFSSNELDSEDMPARHDDLDDGAGRGINGVIRRTYLKGDFSGTVRGMKPFLRNSSAKVRAKAMFYTGLARYRMEQFDRALKYFEHPLTQKFYRRNAEFWINRMAENSR